MVLVKNGKVLTDDGKVASHEDCCCEPCTVSCTQCSSTISGWLVTIADLGNPGDACGDCADFNGEYVVDGCTPVGGQPCCWFYIFPSPICGIDRLDVVIWCLGFGAYIAVRLSKIGETACKLRNGGDSYTDGSGLGAWFPGGYNCQGISELTLIASHWDDGTCIPPGTITVSAL